MPVNAPQKTRYRLISLGRLKPGTNEAEAVKKLQALTKLDELKVRKKLLAGKKTSLLTTDDVTRLASLKGKFSAIGLLVSVAEIPPEPAQPEPQTAKPSSGPRWLKRLGVGFAGLLILTTALAAAGWFWLFKPIADPALAVESALVTERTAAVTHINLDQVNKLLQLSRTSLTDLAADPVGNAPPLVDILADNSLSLSQAFAAVLANDDGTQPDAIVAVTGTFGEAAMRQALSRHYALTETTSPAGLWQLSAKAAAVDADFHCPGDQAPSESVLYVSLADNRFALATSTAALQRFNVRLSNAQPSASLDSWQTYRANKLASLMVFSPKDGSAALPGMAGMIGSQVIASLPDLNIAALSAEVDLLARGLRLNGQLGSNNAGWNQQVATTATTWLNSTRNNAQITSPVAADLMAAIAIQHDAQSVRLDWPITANLVTQLRQSIENTIASAFGGRLNGGDSNEEQIVDDPADYQARFELANLPLLSLNSSTVAPAFHEGPIAIDVDSLSMTDDDVMELIIDAEAAMPEGINDSTLRALVGQSLMVTDVKSRDGESLLREEHCLDVQNVFGGKNHEAATQGSVFFQKASVNKRVRLIPDTHVADIHEIDVTYTLSRPTQIQTFAVPLQAGEQVSYAGVSIDLVSIGNRSIRYRQSGQIDRLLEVRARNAAGQVLQTSWSSSFGRVKDQHYRGQIHQLEVIIAGSTDQRTATASLTGLFEPDLDNETPASPFALSYAPVDNAKWNRYQFVDMRLLRPLADDWTSFYDDERIVGQATWPGMKLVVTHSESGWSGNPTARLYMPLFKELTGSMSALSYRLPDAENPIERFVAPSFPYNAADLTLIPVREVQRQPFGLTNFTLDTGTEAGAELDGINGVLTLRMPRRLSNTALNLNDLWQGQSIEGVRVTLESVERGMFPGYHLKLAGDLDNLIAIHGLDEYGQRVSPITQNFQEAGYWTATIPFRNNMTSVQLVTDNQQAVFEMPFRF
ncbi:hypothetical protein [Reinekea blandensis]|uniref:Uncharacterized protein n=1 Tax=Reinekea blandensis MED297 TaxID=314283 RepID=A4BBB7_9GAMM|nr:hypothetical protein [Reinekea blandensis]EAR10730.1 hypothetical protein MED297_11960 [Reinekea sp. MED297] [Reinekea blandensis MED297]